MKTKRNLTVTLLLFALFIVFTVAVMTVDVGQIGPENSSVGFSTVNGFFFDSLGQNDLWYEITDLLGYVAIGTALAFAVLGVWQLIKRKSLAKVDTEIIVTGVFYVVVVVFYVLFEKFVVNYRPVILEEGLEASYPSSHTVLAVCIMASAIMLFSGILKNRKTLKNAVITVCALIIAVTVIGRLLSGVHWFTDIVGGVLLSAALVSAYCTVLKK